MMNSKLALLSVAIAYTFTSHICVAASADGVDSVYSATELAEYDTQMELARQAFATGDLDRAIALYTRLTQYSEHPKRADALEFLGVARERNGQKAHAKSIYDTYLLEYPQSVGAKRVAQRLNALLAPPATSGTRSKVASKKVSEDKWSIFGSHSNYYRSNTLSQDQGDSINNLSMWQGHLDVVARKQSLSSTLTTRVNASYRQDFTDFGRNRDGLVLSKAYLDFSMAGKGFSTRIGRQSRSSGGVYGRFDGFFAGYALNDKVSLNVVAGYPVRRAISSFESNRVMYGASIKIDDVADAWNFGLFANNHTVDGIVDRRGVGGEFRYFDQSKNLYGILDYDALYSSVNAMMLGGSLTTESRRNFFMTIDYRRNPLLSTSNAVIGQGVATLNELSIGLTEAELMELAEDNTATSTSATFGASIPLSERFQWSSYLQASNLDSAVNFRSLSGVDPNSKTISFNTQLLATSWLRQSDSWIIGARFSKSDTYQTTALSLNMRYPITSKLRINPLLRVMFRTNDVAHSNEWIFTPGLRLSLSWRKHAALEFDSHMEDARRSTDVADTKRSSMYFSLGYRSSFGY